MVLSLYKLLFRTKMVEYQPSGRGEMAYAPGLGPGGATHVGSTPTVRTFDNSP